MKKIIKLIVIVFIGMVGYSFAYDINDCRIVSTDIKQKQQFGNILPESAFEKAVENLKKFCCSQESISLDLSYCDGVDTSGNFPSSANLLDHILDVSIRRLDAKEEDQNGEDLLYKLIPDPAGKERRKFVSTHANNNVGSIPLEISDKYKQTRTVVNMIDTRNGEKIPWNIDTFKNYKNRNLGEKYNSVCESSMVIYLTIKDIRNEDLFPFYEKCKFMINKRIENEYKYTTMILMQQGNNLLVTNTKNYLDKMFYQNKMAGLFNTISDIKSLFLEITKSVQRLISNCT